MTLSPVRSVLVASLLTLGSPPFAMSAAAEDGVSGEAFAPCEDRAAVEPLAGTLCSRMSVPLDHTRPNGEAIELFVRKFPAQGASKGQLWLVAGGPGESGASFYPFIETVRAAAPGLDVIVPDHRGTGYSTRLCPEEESTGSAAGQALAGAEWGSCFGALNSNAERMRAFTVTNAAHDLSTLMNRYETGGHRFLYGVSYGTQLVLRTLTVAPPENLDGVILDSLVPPERTTRFDLSHRSQVTDAVGRKVLRECDSRAECARYLPQGAEAALENVLAREDVAELLGPKPKIRLASLLTLAETRAMIPYVVAGLQTGDRAWLEHAEGRLAELGARFAGYPQAGSSIPLVSLISLSENNARPDLSAETVADEESGLLFASSLPSLLLSGGIPTYAKDANFGELPAVIPPMLVLHGDRDPKTPLEGASEHVAMLRGAGEIHLVEVEGAPHFILMAVPEEFQRTVSDFIDRNAD